MEFLFNQERLSWAGKFVSFVLIQKERLGVSLPWKRPFPQGPGSISFSITPAAPFMKKPLNFLILLCLLGFSNPLLHAQPLAEVEIRLKQVADEAPPLGVNDFGDPGGTRFSAGNLIPGWGFEPLQVRHRWRVSGTGTENGFVWAELDGGGVTLWDLVTTGYLNGADFRIYRIVDAQGQPLPDNGDYLDHSHADRFVQVASGVLPEQGDEENLPFGAWVDEGGIQRVYFPEGTPALRRFDYVYFDKRMTRADPAWSHPRVRTGSIDETWRDTWNAGLEFSRVPHPLPVAEDWQHRGETCLRIEAGSAVGVEVGGPYIFFPERDDGEALWYSVLEPGKTYRFEAWMRQDGLADGGRVALGFQSLYTGIQDTFEVDGEWRLYGFTFVAPEAPREGWHGAPAIRFAGPGVLYLDSIRLFRFDEPAEMESWFVPSPLVFNRLLDSQPVHGEKGILRSMWVLMNEASMASNLSLQRDASLTMDWYQSVDRASNMTLPFFLEYARQTGTTPSTRLSFWRFLIITPMAATLMCRSMNYRRLQNMRSAMGTP